MSKSDTLLVEQLSQEGKSYETTIYVSEDVFNKLLMEGDYEAFISFNGKNTLSLKGTLIKENKSLPENTILTPDSEEVKRLQKERYEKMIEDLKVFERLYGSSL